MCHNCYDEKRRGSWRHKLNITFEDKLFRKKVFNGTIIENCRKLEGVASPIVAAPPPAYSTADTDIHPLNYTSKLSIKPIPAANISCYAKFATFWCLLLTTTTKKLDPESWCNRLSIKQLRMKKIPKDNFT